MEGAEILIKREPRILLALYFGAHRPDGLPSVIDFVQRVEEKSESQRPWIQRQPPVAPETPLSPPPASFFSPIRSLF